MSLECRDIFSRVHAHDMSFCLVAHDREHMAIRAL